MNIHFNPAILMWTEGVQGFDPLPGLFLVLPSGYVKIAIENDHRNSGFSH